VSSFTKSLLGLAAILAGVYLFAPELTPYPIHAILKTAPIWLLAMIALREAPTSIRLPLGLALFFSGIGDFVLSSSFSMSFPVGMAAFLVAHLFYLWIFAKTLRPWQQLDNSRRIMILTIAGYAVVMGVLILPHTGVLMPAIAIYFVVLSLMAAASFAGLSPRWTRLGALLFILSDTLIGIDRFLVPLEFRHLAVMGTYYAAQALIVAGLCWQTRNRPSSPM